MADSIILTVYQVLGRNEVKNKRGITEGEKNNNNNNNKKKATKRAQNKLEESKIMIEVGLRKGSLQSRGAA